MFGFPLFSQGKGIVRRVMAMNKFLLSLLGDPTVGRELPYQVGRQWLGLALGSASLPPTILVELTRHVSLGLGT